MKSKHLHNKNLHFTIEMYQELRKGLKLGDIKWSSLSKELKTAYHNFDEDKRISDFEKQLHKITTGEFDYEI